LEKYINGRLLKYAYPIFFSVHLKDKSKVTFEAMLGTNRKSFIEAIQFLESKNVVFKYEYELLDKIKDMNTNIWESIEEIIAENKLSIK